MSGSLLPLFCDEIRIEKMATTIPLALDGGLR